jgi:signal transduction histidine kinase
MVLLNFFLGAVAMQVVYLLYHFLISRRLEFLNYLLFVICISAFIAIINWEAISSTNLGVFTTYRYAVGYSFLFLAIMQYFMFARHISAMPQKSPRVNFVLRVFEVSFFIMALAIIAELIIFGKTYFTPFAGRLLYIISFGAQAYLIIYLIRTRELLNYFIVAGSLAMSLLIKQVLIPLLFYSPMEREHLTSYILMGVILDFLFLNFALVYRSLQLEKEKFKMKLARQAALYQQRLEISNDLHDDVGSTLSSLQVYSTIARQSVADPEQTAGYIDKIGSGIRKVMENMNDVIWAVKNDTSNEKLLSSKIKDHYVDLLDACNIVCEYRMDEQLELMLTRILARKNLLLITKEAINNIIKHSGAKKVTISLYTNDRMMILAIEDDGKGIQYHWNGNGLQSMENRTRQLDGEFYIGKGQDGSGTLIKCIIPLAKITD